MRSLPGDELTPRTRPGSRYWVMSVPAPGPPPAATSTVTSIDGTTIGYYSVGAGPGVILLHGAGQSSKNLRKLADHLADCFAVHVPDRRGRGMSPSYGSFAGLRSEIEDLCALLDATGARRVFGLSAGAVIAIETARVRPDIEKLALYEPPLSFDGVVHGAWVDRYEDRMAAGRPGAALVAVLKDTADRRSLVRYVPEFFLAAVLDLVIKRTADRPVPPGALSPRELIPTLRYDAPTVREASGSLERFADLGCQILLLTGSRSARNLQASVEGLATVLPSAHRAELRGVGHTAADDSRQPELVAGELVAFFSGDGS